MDTEDRIAQLEFQTELLFNGTPVDRFVFESKITRKQYTAIVNLMEEFRSKIDEGQKVSHRSFEDRIYEIVPEKYGDYHFCELLTKSFAEDGQWEEVFPALYGHMAKYGGTGE